VQSFRAAVVVSGAVVQRCRGAEVLRYRDMVAGAEVVQSRCRVQRSRCTVAGCRHRYRGTEVQRWYRWAEVQVFQSPEVVQVQMPSSKTQMHSFRLQVAGTGAEVQMDRGAGPEVVQSRCLLKRSICTVAGADAEVQMGRDAAEVQRWCGGT